MKATKMRQGLFIQEDRATQGSTIKGRTVNRKQEVNYREHRTQEDMPRQWDIVASLYCTFLPCLQKQQSKTPHFSLFWSQNRNFYLKTGQSVLCDCGAVSIHKGKDVLFFFSLSLCLCNHQPAVLSDRTSASSMQADANLPLLATMAW